MRERKEAMEESSRVARKQGGAERKLLMTEHGGAKGGMQSKEA